MKKVKKLVPGGIYILRGMANANSLEFETKKESIIFFTLVNKYLKNYLEIIEYALTPDGWELLVRIRDKRTLIKHIVEDSSSASVLEWSVSKIIGERVRHLRSTFRKRLNQIQGRKGYGVRCCYEKFVLTNVEEAKQRIADLKAGKIRLEQPIERFRGIEDQYDTDKVLRKEWRKGISLLTSRALREKGSEVVQDLHGIRLKVLYLLDVQDDVLHTSIKSTAKAHNFAI